MYEDLIQQFNPKPKFNLAWYNNLDSYSEGAVEDVIIDIIAQNEPEEYVQAIADHYNWSTFYHLTHMRKNILNWYPFSKEATVLEIGCGLGAITGMLCDRCREVTAIELSKRRAMGALLRCREKENLEIIVGNLNDIQLEKKFDYITLIGVLEYQGSYTDTENPYMDFLKKVKGLLKPNGKLLVAIENQYGLKYWCGAREDHTGIPFEGMNQYTISKKKVRTFSKETLDSLIKESGFKNTFFYYPMPDYKLPTAIFSQKVLPENENMMDMKYYYAPDNMTLVAQEEKIYKDIIDNNVFEFFANSFLVECSDSAQVGKVSFASLSCQRFAEYQVGTKFSDKGDVIKFPLKGYQGERHLNEIIKNEERLKERNLNIWSSELREGVLISDFCQARTLEDILIEEYKNKNFERIFAIFDDIYLDILMSSEKAAWQDNILYTFDLGIEPDEDKYGIILKTGYLDMIPRNAFWKNEKIYWFDQEWILENVPARFVLYRAFVRLYSSFPEINQILPLSSMIQRYDLVKVREDFSKLDGMFYRAVIDYTHVSECTGFRKDIFKACIENIGRLITY